MNRSARNCSTSARAEAAGQALLAREHGRLALQVAFRSVDFDICELSLSSYTVKTALGECPYVGIPAFVSKAFRHTSIYVRTDRIKEPKDLKGRKVGVPEYQLTANVWARAILQDDFDVTPADIHWIRGGIEEPGRPEKITVKLPPGVRLDNAPEGTTISALLEKGEIDGFIAPRPPSIAHGHPHVGWLFRDPMAAAKEWYSRTKFPDHAFDRGTPDPGGQAPVVAGGGAQGLRTIQVGRAGGAQRHLGHQGDAALRRGGAEIGTRPDGRRLLVLRSRSNRKTLEMFLRHHHAQGLSPRLMQVEEMFHPSVYETFML